MPAPTVVTHTELNAAAAAVQAIFDGSRDEARRQIDWSRAFALNAINAWQSSSSLLSAVAVGSTKELYLPVPMKNSGTVTLTQFRARTRRATGANFSTVLYRVDLATGTTAALSTLTTAQDLFQTLDSGALAIVVPASNALFIRAVSAAAGDEFAGAIVNFTVGP